MESSRIVTSCATPDIPPSSGLFSPFSPPCRSIGPFPLQPRPKPSPSLPSASTADFLRNSGIATYIDGKHAIAHNKIMIIDRECVITGSFNFTKAAEEKNAENILVIRGNPDLTSKYIGNFDWHLRHSEPYQGRGG
jgi:phosphatidylserine/phosphatidylglycerophosphate/cardiolipin synthase-like enzyme